MTLTTRRSIVVLGLSASFSLAAGLAHAAGPVSDDDLRRAVDAAAASVMDEYKIPGLSIGVVADGQPHLFHYGVTAPGGDQAVSDDTIFEMGSISKTFTATLGAYAQVTGRLAMSDTAAKHMPELDGAPIGNATLEQLGTYAAGGLPLQFPDEVKDDSDTLGYYKAWQPEFPAGTQRVYSNPSIGLFGNLAARALGGDFATLMQNDLLPALGLSNTYVTVPEQRMQDYAWGQKKDGDKARVNPGPFDAEAYGIKTTAADLLHFVNLHMDPDGLEPDWADALALTRTPVFRAGGMMQGLGWESYPVSVTLDDLQAGNGNDVSMKPNPTEPVGTAPEALLLNKTGSTNGFGNYVAFMPSKRVGVVLLANRNYPIAARIEAAHSILSALD